MSEHPNKKKWVELAEKQMKGKSIDTLDWTTPEGITVKPLYTAEDLEGMESVNTLPGMEPYVRGPMATMYAGRPWTIRQYAGFSTAEESNAFYRKALAGGGQGISKNLQTEIGIIGRNTSPSMTASKSKTTFTAGSEP